ncbi:hypothetical protein E2C01_087479 [Portunus trituberculatus]|uniref:Uncharacterized protein n=1 Tax=Portunus trituberculatus TaxID=210409 RepID=A0A5B7J3F8_PORTR|nr:hypothetical protein [Portunus trituberculatus]
MQMTLSGRASLGSCVSRRVPGGSHALAAPQSPCPVGLWHIYPPSAGRPLSSPSAPAPLSPSAPCTPPNTGPLSETLHRRCIIAFKGQ